MYHEITFLLNNESRRATVLPTETLLDMLRYKMGVTSPKSGCERGDCGTCTIKMNGLLVKSCLILAVEADGQELLTIEGVMPDNAEGLTDLQRAFIENNSFQCGFCAPGMVMAAEDLLEKNPNPSDHEIKEGLGGNLCRCTGYTPIIDAVKAVVIERQKGGGHE